MSKFGHVCRNYVPRIRHLIHASLLFLGTAAIVWISIGPGKWGRDLAPVSLLNLGRPTNSEAVPKVQGENGYHRVETSPTRFPSTKQFFSSPFIFTSDEENNDYEQNIASSLLETAVELSYGGYLENLRHGSNNSKLNRLMSSGENPLDIDIVRQTVSPSQKGDIKTIAMIMPCKFGPPGCFFQGAYPLDRCEYRCRQTWTWTEADVVTFYVIKMKSPDRIPQFIRPPGQIWVMIDPEAACRGGNHAMLDSPVFKDQFNWTLTYRLDSDIPRLYGTLERVPPRNKDYQAIYSGKYVTAAWFVSNCLTQSKRFGYVRRMQILADVHIFGRCGDYNCSYGSEKRGQDRDVCFPMLSRSYFFYLAFENSLCKDYVTEKFFKMFEDVDIVPVVRGGADYKRYFPPNTFIDASDFKSPEELAKYLVGLAEDKDRYISILKEKTRYRRRKEEKWFCKLCKRIHTDHGTKWYSDIRSWYVKDMCHPPTDL